MNTEKDFTGYLFGQKVNYLDFFNSNTANYMNEQMKNLLKNIDFEGIYIDKNEIFNDC